MCTNMYTAHTAAVWVSCMLAPADIMKKTRHVMAVQHLPEQCGAAVRVIV